MHRNNIQKDAPNHLRSFVHRGQHGQNGQVQGSTLTQILIYDKGGVFRNMAYARCLGISVGLDTSYVFKHISKPSHMHMHAFSIQLSDRIHSHKASRVTCALQRSGPSQLAALHAIGLPKATLDVAVLNLPLEYYSSYKALHVAAALQNSAASRLNALHAKGLPKALLDLQLRSAALGALLVPRHILLLLHLSPACV